MSKSTKLCVLRTRRETLRPLAIMLPLTFSRLRASTEELLTLKCKPGQYSGDLVIAERSEPKTFNPVIAIDAGSRAVIQLIMADLVHINRESHRTEPALAREFTASADGRRYLLHLRRGLRFSDGYPFDADDVLFTFEVYLNEKVRSPQRDLLIVDGKPILVRKQDSHSIVIEFASPYAPAERLFDSIAILPRHLLRNQYLRGSLAEEWDLRTQASRIAGLGPFRFKEYIPGQHLILERNPYYWKEDLLHVRLPYLRRIIFDYVASEDAQVISFRTGMSDVITRLNARNFEVLSRELRKSHQLKDLGPGLEYSFLFFNLNNLAARNLPHVQAKQVWFRDLRFRRAVSAAIDRRSIVRLVYAGRATPIWSHVTPGNRLWANNSLSSPPYSVETARALLTASGFSWKPDGALVDPSGQPVEFSIITNAGNSDRVQMAALIQHDLGELGITVRMSSLEFRSMLDRVMNTFDYDACILGFTSGDADPGSEMNVWLSTGTTHLWDLKRTPPDSDWQAEIDRLMKAQMIATSRSDRKRLYDRVQELVAEYLPVICLVSPNILVGAKTGLENFRPAVLSPYVLWNAEELFWRK
jgi:peptide/nickel transport system substrate-binding protein